MFASLAKHRAMIVPIAFVLLLGVLLVPLPPGALDVLIVCNIALAVIILLTTLNLKKSLEFSVFPALLLATTLFRLVLNIASTRLILTADASGPEDAAAVAGHVILAFGEFVAGGSLFVGVILFLILMIVQFVVITKGAGRISEVAARFTLDAMPGKQMAIDSDLSAGAIDENEARQRRKDIAREADFFGAMDGASKFVKGDAIAGIIITAVNLIGGFAVGMLEKGWPAGQVAETFTKLTIGDGLTSQIPSFVIAIASAMIVARAGTEQELGQDMAQQLLSQPKGLGVTAAFLLLLSFTPLPTMPLFAGAVVLGLIAFFMLWGERKRSRSRRTEAEERAVAEREAAEPPPVEDLLKVDTLELELGYGLVGLVNGAEGGDLLDRIAAVRRQLAVDMGLVMPPVRIRDNLTLEPDRYRVKVRSNPVAEGLVRPNHVLAMDSGLAGGPIEGERTREPAFGLEAWWIDPALQSRAESLNFTVVDPTSVVATHITEIVKRHAPELLTRSEVSNLIEGVKQHAPKVVEDLVPGVVKLGEVQKILQNLLRERVPIRDMETVLEAIGDWAPKTKDLDVLTEYVRHALRRTICRLYAQPDDRGTDRLVCVTLDPQFEDQIAAYIDRGPAGATLTMPARVTSATAEHIMESLQRVTERGHHPVVIASPQVRATVRQIIEPVLPMAAVLGYNEVEQGVEVESLGLVQAMRAGGAAQPAGAA